MHHNILGDRLMIVLQLVVDRNHVINWSASSNKSIESTAHIERGLTLTFRSCDIIYLHVNRHFMEPE